MVDWAMSGSAGALVEGMGFLQLTTEGPALTSAPGISIQPWKCPLSLLTCGMDVLPYKPPTVNAIPNPKRPFEFYERAC